VKVVDRKGNILGDWQGTVLVGRAVAVGSLRLGRRRLLTLPLVYIEEGGRMVRAIQARNLKQAQEIPRFRPAAQKERTA